MPPARGANLRYPALETPVYYRGAPTGRHHSNSTENVEEPFLIIRTFGPNYMCYYTAMCKDTKGKRWLELDMEIGRAYELNCGQRRIIHCEL